MSDLPDVSNLASKYTVNEDSRRFIAHWQAEHEAQHVSTPPKPCALSGYHDTAELLLCPDTQQYMTVRSYGVGFLGKGS